MSALARITDSSQPSRHVRKVPRLCENAHQPRMRRIVFSISFFRQVLPVQLVFTSTKSRRKFYTQVERQSFHTASTQSGHLARRTILAAVGAIADIDQLLPTIID